MKKNIINVMSCSLSVLFIFSLLGLTFCAYTDFMLVERKTLPNTPPNKKTLENKIKVVAKVKKKLRPIILPPPPLKTPTKSQSDWNTKISLLTPTVTKNVKTKKFKNNPNKSNIKKAKIKMLLIKPIKPTALRQKVDLANILEVPKYNLNKADQIKTKIPLSKNLNQIKPIQKSVKINRRLVRDRSSGIDNTQIGKVVKKGRALLRILEHGSGPDITFAWPDSNNARHNLFMLLRKCYGMQTVLLSQNKKLYRQSDMSGRSWLIDMDKISGFTRMAGGKLTQLEQKIIKQTRRQHSQIQLDTVVRMFPRKFDGGLLGELARFMDNTETKIRSISARYKQDNRGLFMEDIRVNGRIVDGQIDLRPYSTCNNSRTRI